MIRTPTGTCAFASPSRGEGGAPSLSPATADRSTHATAGLSDLGAPGGGVRPAHCTITPTRNAIGLIAPVAFEVAGGDRRNKSVAFRPPPSRGKQGDAVKLRWTADRPMVLHLHGYDIETKVEPGAVAEMAFAARATGRFPIEEHKPDAKGGHSHGEAPLVRIEVRPR
jgi:hypothetical protein